MEKRFYSNGKLLITGEYVVLDGADAFALPTKSGQELIVSPGADSQITWQSFDADGSLWFEDTILFSEIFSGHASRMPVKDTLVAILHQAHKSNPQVLASSGFSVTSRLTFPRKWGLGTSSTLINNIADWFETDPFELLKNSFGGSGYDIACARNDSPVLYNIGNGKPIIKKCSFSPKFLPMLYFVYLNRKQNSKNAIASYRKKQFDPHVLVGRINELTQVILNAASVKEFCEALEKHEALLSQALQTSPVKQALFADFNGALKSLGAWGGDFVLAVSDADPSGYFKAKGYQTVIPYGDMIL